MEKGISPIVSYVMVIAIVLTTTMAAYMWALPLSKEMGEKGRVTNLQSQMIGLDYIIRTTAHGDINFQNKYEMYLPDCFLLLDEGNNSIKLRLSQKTGVIGTNTTEVEIRTDCNETSQWLIDNETGIKMYRLGNNSNIFRGAVGPAAGDAEIAICYHNINLRYSGDCTKGKGGPFATIITKKTGYDTKPIVEVSIC